MVRHKLLADPMEVAASIAHEKDRRTFLLLMMTDLSDLEEMDVACAGDIRAVMEAFRKHGVEMPVCEAVAAVVKGQMTVDEAVEALLSRPLRPESDFLPAAFMAAPVTKP